MSKLGESGNSFTIRARALGENFRQPNDNASQLKVDAFELLPRTVLSSNGIDVGREILITLAKLTGSQEERDEEEINFLPPFCRANSICLFILVAKQLFPLPLALGLCSTGNSIYLSASCEANRFD